MQRTQRLEEARVLLADLASSPVLSRRNDAQTFAELGQMLASVDLFDAAIKMIDRAAAGRSSSALEDEVSRIQMNRALATKYQTFNSGHFEIHYPDDVSPLFATQIGNVLESELKRLQKWVPTPSFRTTVVNVVWWRDFRSTLTGSDFILGLYQGKITVPLAGIPDFYPPIVAILSHELLHAMLAQATNDSAQRRMARKVRLFMTVSGRGEPRTLSGRGAYVNKREARDVPEPQPRRNQGAPPAREDRGRGGALAGS